MSQNCKQYNRCCFETALGARTNDVYPDLLQRMARGLLVISRSNYCIVPRAIWKFRKQTRKLMIKQTDVAQFIRQCMCRPLTDCMEGAKSNKPLSRWHNTQAFIYESLIVRRLSCEIRLQCRQFQTPLDQPETRTCILLYVHLYLYGQVHVDTDCSQAKQALQICLPVCCCFMLRLYSLHVHAEGN